MIIDVAATSGRMQCHPLTPHRRATGPRQAPPPRSGRAAGCRRAAAAAAAEADPSAPAMGFHQTRLLAANNVASSDLPPLQLIVR
jgi:hypothetical protein